MATGRTHECRVLMARHEAFPAKGSPGLGKRVKTFAEKEALLKVIGALHLSHYGYVGRKDDILVV